MLQNLKGLERRLKAYVILLQKFNIIDKCKHILDASLNIFKRAMIEYISL